PQAGVAARLRRGHSNESIGENNGAITTSDRPPTAQAGLADLATVKTALVHSDQWVRFDYGPEHPLRMERLGLTFRLMEAYGLTSLTGSSVKSPEPAEEAALLKFHTEEYLNVLKAANTGAASAAGACRYGLGPGDNPIFPGLWDAPRLAAGGPWLAAPRVRGGGGPRAWSRGAR